MAARLKIRAGKPPDILWVKGILYLVVVNNNAKQ
jgi:hypothetical protein